MLKEQPEIEDAKAVAIYGEREEIDAVAVLNEFGKTSLKETNKAAFDRMLRKRLHGLLTRAARPRRFRYVDAMPVDAMGKTTQAALVALFSKRPLPEAKIVNRESFVCRLRLKMSEAKFAFDGHFPKFPVLPGVTQVDWAVRFAQRYLSSGHYWSDEDLSTVNQLKFTRLARPADVLLLDLKIEPEKKQLSFHYSLESGEKVSQGIARFKRKEEAS
jgi:3-hydroxymyristoyl/3-hydroxydecanoyl-(acyl carrier protein) dehydratase